MLGQVTTLLENAGTLTGDADEKLAGLLMRLRSLALYYLIELGDSMPQAIVVGKSLTADLERTLGPDHPDALNARDSLAAAYQAAGLIADAIPLFERTLVDRERMLGPDHPDTLTSQNKLAAAYQAAGRANEAILLFRLTLAARERMLGLDHPDTLHSRTSLAAAYRDAGRAADAIPLVQRTLATREQLLGADHPSTLASRNNLASVYRAAGRPAEAIPLFEQNVAACERLLGPDDPKTVASRHNLDLARHEAEPAEHAEQGPDTGSPEQDSGTGLVDQVGGHLQDDGPELVPVVHLLQVEHAGRADGEHGGGGAHPVAQRRVGTDEHVDERVEPDADPREPLLARLHGLHRGPVLLQEAEDRVAGQHDAHVAVQELAAGLARRAAGPWPSPGGRRSRRSSRR